LRIKVLPAVILLLFAGLALGSSSGFGSWDTASQGATFAALSKSRAVLLGTLCFVLAVYGKRRKNAREY